MTMLYFLSYNSSSSYRFFEKSLTGRKTGAERYFHIQENHIRLSLTQQKRHHLQSNSGVLCTCSSLFTLRLGALRRLRSEVPELCSLQGWTQRLSTQWSEQFEQIYKRPCHTALEQVKQNSFMRCQVGFLKLWNFCRHISCSL